jgi:hypothetical protein
MATTLCQQIADANLENELPTGPRYAAAYSAAVPVPVSHDRERKTRKIYISKTNQHDQDSKLTNMTESLTLMLSQAHSAAASRTVARCKGQMGGVLHPGH